MLVYGDPKRIETGAEKIAHIGRFLALADGQPPGIVRHGYIVAALIEAGELAQGLADAAFHARGGQDGPSAQADGAMALCLVLARLVASSWRGEPGESGEVWAALAMPALQHLREQLEIKQPEGFGHYCVYPESYLQAALPLAGRDVSVIGIRSIGTSLAAIVAAATGARRVTTVRPVGHPFFRELSLSPEASDDIADEPRRDYAIVDEGPGMSGSSITAVARMLSDRGVGAERIHIFPSHANGPGAQVSEQDRAFWRSARQHVVTFDDLPSSAGDPAHRLSSWTSDLVGVPVAPPVDISGGGWRRLRFAEADWPPVHAWQERRKFLLETEAGTFLLKFVGLGRTGLAKVAQARQLADAAFTPEPMGYRHGFIVERWLGGCRPLNPEGAERPALLATLSAYLGFRARMFRTEPSRGASAEELLRMASVNARDALGERAAARFEPWRAALDRIGRRSSSVETDNRLQAWEWLAGAEGGILKTDALDHHAGHDLIGCQDIAWDIAGAATEFLLSDRETESLMIGVEAASGSPVDDELVRFMTLCYPAFQLGYWREAAASCEEAEMPRLRAAARRYEDALQRALRLRPARSFTRMRLPG